MSTLSKIYNRVSVKLPLYAPPLSFFTALQHYSMPRFVELQTLTDFEIPNVTNWKPPPVPEGPSLYALVCSMLLFVFNSIVSRLQARRLLSKNKSC